MRYDKKHLIDMTKQVYKSFILDKGKYKLLSSSYVDKRELNNSAVSFLSSYLDFVMSSNIITQNTKVYIRSDASTPKDIANQFNMDNPDLDSKLTNIQVAKSNDYSANKMLKYFPVDMIDNILRKNGGMTEYEGKLQQAIDENMGNGYWNKRCCIKIPGGVCEETPSQEDMNYVCMILAPYMQAQTNLVESQLMVYGNVIRYFNYLLMKNKPTEEEQVIINRLKQLEKDIEMEIE